ncbi:nucleoside-diphosphate-sugar epimerase [Spiribacter vilamensis]|uniref:Nucleoside-diphosphate-sugar epimerase n=1 Tax=Spiribacter vilamensis TaxID=531306 RepID=A0A4Q8D2P4_9GAMM|nr:nucleoside-diphosphate-sugar epimerase [Spiribacter vilamensis]
MHFCVTGASGFVGKAVVQKLVSRGDYVTAIARTRQHRASHGDRVEWVQCDLCESTPPRESLGTVDAIIHLAGRAHVLNERGSDTVPVFQRANAEATERLAALAARVGIQRFVFASSIGVHGSSLADGAPVSESSVIDPLEPYAVSKWEAEQRLRRVEDDTNLEVAVVRPALVVGPAAPGNLNRLARLVRRGLPVPVPRVDNARSFVELDHLVDLLIRCAERPEAAGETFAAAECDWPSTREVIEWIGEGAGRHMRCIRLPNSFLRGAARLVGQGRLYDKLYGDLRVDAAHARQRLGWQTPRPLADAFRDVGWAFRNSTG